MVDRAAPLLSEAPATEASARLIMIRNCPSHCHVASFDIIDYYSDWSASLQPRASHSREESPAGGGWHHSIA